MFGKSPAWLTHLQIADVWPTINDFGCKRITRAPRLRRRMSNSCYKYSGLVRSMVALGVLVLHVASPWAQGRGSKKAGPKWVTTKRQLVEHVQAHRLRMAHLAEGILHVGGERYKSVDRRVLALAIFEHDEMKVTTDRTLLRSFGFDRMVAGHLVEFWGRALSDNSGLDASSGAKVLKRMNEGDHWLEQKFPVLVLEIVHLADKIDKGVDPITKFEELGRTAVPASQYLRNPLNPEYNPVLAGFALQIEQRYDEIVPRVLSSTEFRKGVE